MKGECYYHVTSTAPRKWTPLGRGRARALLEWARIEGTEPDPNVRTFEVIALRYEREVMPGKAARTQRDNLIELDRLRAVFGRVLIDSIKPHHVRAYLDKRGEQAKARANREKALLSHVINKAREWGYTDAPNPCQGVKGFTEKGRDRYVTDAEFQAVHAAAHPTVRDAMDIALLTGQRPADVLKIRLEDLHDGALHITQTGRKTQFNRRFKSWCNQATTRVTARLTYRINTPTDHANQDHRATMNTATKTAKSSNRPSGSDFELRRGHRVEDNIRRLRKHLDRIERTPEHCRWVRAIRLKTRIRAMRAAT